MAKEVVVKAEKIKNRKRRSRVVKLSLLILLLLLTILYLILRIIYNEGRFTISLDSNDKLKSGLAIFESLNNSQGKRKLEASPIKFMDNISYKTIPKDVDTEADGPHNGKNYIAYSFYAENQGKETIDYWYEIVIDDVIKNVDEAVRIRIYRNGESITYAKKKSNADEPEEGTTAFRDDIDSKENIIIFEQVHDFKPNDLDRYTIVIWLEGDDPDCTNAIIGGELKMHMKFTEEHVRN